MNPPPAEGLASRLFMTPALRTQPDRRLVRLVRDGYDTAFEEIVRRYGKPLGRYASAIVGSRSDDVLQDSLSKALLALRRDRDAEIELRPWLYRIVRNTALNDLRDRPAQAEELLESMQAGARSAAEEVERREELSELLGRLRALPDAQRAAIVMRELEGLGHDEIAAALGISGGAARQAIHRARTALRDGIGMLIPSPMLRSLVDHGTEAGAATGAGGAVAAAGGSAGAGAVMKVGVVTAVLAGSVGTGMALKEDTGREGQLEVARAASAPQANQDTTTGSEAGETGQDGAAGADHSATGSDNGPSGSSGEGHGGSRQAATGAAQEASGNGSGRGERGSGFEGGPTGVHDGQGGPGPGGRGDGQQPPPMFEGSHSGPGGGSYRRRLSGGPPGGGGGSYPSGGGSYPSGGGGSYSGGSGSGDTYGGGGSNSGPGGGGDGGYMPPPPPPPDGSTSGDADRYYDSSGSGSGSGGEYDTRDGDSSGPG